MLTRSLFALHLLQFGTAIAWKLVMAFLHLRWEARENGLDNGTEPHVEQLIGFVENEGLQCLHVGCQVAVLQQVEQPFKVTTKPSKKSTSILMCTRYT